MYIILSLISGIVLGLFYIVKKKVVNGNDIIKVLFVHTTINFLLVASTYNIAFNVTNGELLFIMIKSVIIYIGWILSSKAVKELPLSISSPLGILNPIFTVFLGIFLLGENLNVSQIIGITIIFTSYYFICKVGELEVKDIFKNKYIYFMSLAMLFASINSIMDKQVLKSIPVDALQFWFNLMLAAMYAATVIIKNRIKVKEMVEFKFNYWLILMSVFLVIADKIYYYAAKIPEANISIIIPLRYISIIIATIIGGLIFKEENIDKKFKYIIGLIVGIVLIFI